MAKPPTDRSVAILAAALASVALTVVAAGCGRDTVARAVRATVARLTAHAGAAAAPVAAPSVSGGAAAGPGSLDTASTDGATVRVTADRPRSLRLPTAEALEGPER